MKMTVSILSLTFLAACSGSGSSSTSNQTTQLSYDMTENNCPTGAHQFSSQAEYCAALKSNSLNNSCALDLRRSEYTQNCGTDFVTTN